MGFWNTIGRGFKHPLGIFGAAAESKSGKKLLQGTPEVRENVSTLRPEQEKIYQNSIDAARKRGAPGVQGQAADIYRDLGQSEAANYYRSNLGNNPADFNAFAAPELRQYNEQIVPGLSEQFAGMGAGGLSSSGFRNAQVQGATDLSERLGALRAQLRQNSAANLHNINMQQAQGLQGINREALGNFSQNMTTDPGSNGFFSDIAPLAGAAAGAYFGGAPGATAGYQAGQAFTGNKGNNVGQNKGPYGEYPQASPRWR